MTSVLMLLAEALVAVLLVACMVACARLGRRIAKLQADETAMRRTIGELVQATENAERAIAGLRATLGDCDRTLAERLRTAERYSADLANQVEAGESMMGRIMQIVESSRRAGTPEPTRVVAPEPPQARVAPPIVVPPRPQPTAEPAPRPAAPATSARISAAAELLAERVARRVGRT